MRRLALGQPLGGTVDAKVNWLVDAVKRIELASNEDFALTVPIKPIAGLGVAVKNVQQALEALEPGVGVREALTANRTYYVRDDGSDSNDGLANTVGGAFLTIQTPISLLLNRIDLNGFNVEIICTGSFAGGVLIDRPWTGRGAVTLTGDITTPANATLTHTGGNTIGLQAAAQIYLRGFKIENTDAARAGIRVSDAAILTIIGKMEFGACSGQHMFASRGGAILNASATHTISGGATAHMRLQHGGYITNLVACTYTVSGTPDFSVAFVQGALNSSGNLPDLTFSGSATGTRYALETLTSIDTDGGGASYFPGDSSGTTATGAEYV